MTRRRQSSSPPPAADPTVDDPKGAPPREVAGDPKAVAAPGDAEKILSTARAYEVDSPIMFQAASEELRSIIKRRIDIDNKRKELVAPMLEGQRRINDFFKAPLQALEDAEEYLRRSIGTWDRKERERIESERRAAEAAQRRERDEAERVASQARAAAAEAQRKADELAAKGRANTKTGIQAAEKAAQAAEKAASAESVAETAAIAPPVLVAGPTKAAGVGFRDVWKFEVTDKLELLKHVVANPMFLNLVDTNDEALRNLAKAVKDSGAVPGLRIYSDNRPTVRSSST